MAKYKKEKVEIQKGPINLNEQYTYRFHQPTEPTRQDIEYNEMRQDKMTMTLHEPKK
jgi:hypothetical protein